MVRRYLSVGSISIVGENHSRNDDALAIVKEIKPKILCLEEPQDWASYFELYRNGSSEAEIKDAIENDGKHFMLGGIFHKFAQLDADIERMSVENVYFVDTPSVISTLSPFFLTHSYAPLDDTVRSILMTTRAVELNKQDSSLVMKVGAAHEPCCYKTLSEFQEANPSTKEITQQKFAMYQLLEQIVTQFSEHVQTNQETLQKQYLQTSEYFLRNRNLIFTGLHNNEDISSLMEEQLTLADDLSVMSFDMQRRHLPESYFKGLLQLRTLAKEHLESGKLREDIINTINPV